MDFDDSLNDSHGSPSAREGIAPKSLGNVQWVFWEDGRALYEPIRILGVGKN